MSRTGCSSVPKMVLPLPGAGSKPTSAALALMDASCLTMLGARAGAALLARIGGIGLGEFLENARLEFLRDAGPLVTHPDPDLLCPPLDADRDLAAHGRELDRVGEQVGDDLGEPIAVGEHSALVRCLVEPEAHTKVVREGAIGFHGLFQQGTQFEIFEMKDDLASLDPLQVEDVVDQPHQPLAVGVRDREQPHRRIGQMAGRVAHEQAERAGNRGERRAQLVAHHGDEFVLLRRSSRLRSLMSTIVHSAMRPSRVRIGLRPISAETAAVRRSATATKLLARTGRATAAPRRRSSPRRRPDRAEHDQAVARGLHRGRSRPGIRSHPGASR